MVVKRYVISGLVQGVGFRNFVQKRARGLGLRGWVRNLADGRVEAMVLAEGDELEQLETYISRGPMAAKVTQVMMEVSEISDSAAGDLPVEFEIRYDV